MRAKQSIRSPAANVGKGHGAEAVNHALHVGAHGHKVVADDECGNDSSNTHHACTLDMSCIPNATSNVNTETPMTLMPSTLFAFIITFKVSFITCCIFLQKHKKAYLKLNNALNA